MFMQHTVSVQRRLADDLATVVDKLLAELLREPVGLPTRRVALVDVVLHVFEKVGVGAVHDGNAASGDLAVDGGETSEDDIVEHEKRVLTDPVPRRVEVASLERVERGLDAVHVAVAVLLRDTVELGLQSGRASLLLVVRDLASTRIASEVAHEEVDLLADETVLVRLELEEFFAVDDSAARRRTAATSASRRE